eukprot:TRINITY_DN20725_c0_g1_i2.p2 TRINITY_DN20725_c0_g1~~TRINITY_DN20725_c0_g1_i2.p2  ORF type:complete len:308 (-),score=89.97 TRINITY_DN20725_c0_g1_i2:51-974(-)
MSGMRELLDELAIRKAAKFDAEQAGKAAVREAEEATRRARQDLDALRRAHAQELCVLKADRERCLRAETHAGSAALRKVQAELRTARAREEDSQRRRLRAEAEAETLRRRAEEVREQVRSSTQRLASYLTELGAQNEDRIRLAKTCSDDRVVSATALAASVEETSTVAIDSMALELQSQAVRTALRSEGRARLHELIQIARRRDEGALTPDGFAEAKGQLLTLWRAQTNVLEPDPSLRPVGDEEEEKIYSSLAPQTTPGFRDFLGFASPPPSPPKSAKKLLEPASPRDKHILLRGKRRDDKRFVAAG